MFYYSTCGDPKMPHMPGQGNFEGKIYHSSELDGKDVKGKKVAVIGGGASAVEALEFTSAAGAAKTFVLSRVGQSSSSISQISDSAPLV